MANEKNAGRNWTRRSIEEIFDDMFKKYGGGGGSTATLDVSALTVIEGPQTLTYSAGRCTTYHIWRGFGATSNPVSTIENRPFGTNNGIVPIVVSRLDIFNTSLAFDILHSIYFFNTDSFRIGASQLVCVPPTGQDIYLVKVADNDTFNVSHVTYIMRPETAPYQFFTRARMLTSGNGQSTTDTVDVITNALQGVPGFVNGCMLMIINPNSGTMNNHDILVLANYFNRNTGTNYNNVIVV